MVTKLNSVNIGHNKYCGPAVLSILTGKSTDECARVISSITGQYNIESVYLSDLLRAADKLGFDHQSMPIGNSLYSTLVMHANNDGMYIFTLPTHFVCIEVKEKKIYFCDNHTKEPMPAASSARMLQKVTSVHKVTKRPEVVIEQPKPKSESEPAKTYTYKEAIQDISLILRKCLPEYEMRIRIGCVISAINEE